MPRTALHTQFVLSGGSGPLQDVSPTLARHPQPGVPLAFPSPSRPHFCAAAHMQSAIYFCTQRALLHCTLGVNQAHKSPVFAALRHTLHTELTEILQTHILLSVHIHYPFCLIYISLRVHIFPLFSSTPPGRVFNFDSIVCFVTITIMKSTQWP